MKKIYKIHFLVNLFFVVINYVFFFLDSEAKNLSILTHTKNIKAVVLNVTSLKKQDLNSMILKIPNDFI